MSFCFRIRFTLLPNDRVKATETSLRIPIQDPSATLKLQSGSLGTPIGEHTKLALLGGPYGTTAEASDAGEKARRALLLWALQRRRGIDISDRKPQSVITDYGKSMLAGRWKRPVRQSV